MRGPFDLDGLVLLPQCSQKGVDETPNVRNDVPKVDRNPAIGDRIGDRQYSQQASTHLHFVGWEFRDYPTNLCAIVEDFVNAGRYHGGSGRYLRFVESETESPQMGYTVFVSVGEIVQVEQGIMDWQTPVRIRLQRLDECLWAVPDVFDTPLPESSELSWVLKDREHGLVVLDSGLVKGELEYTLIDGAPKVIDNLPKENRKVERDGRVESKTEDVLREVALYRGVDAIGARLGLDVLSLEGSQEFRLVIRPFDFEQNRAYCQTVRFPDMDVRHATP